MGGSAFIDPYEQPFDIVEYTDTTRGVKNLETYRLAGAISTDLTHRVTLSAKVDYHAANYAKQKNLPRMIGSMRQQGLPAPDYEATTIDRVTVKLSRFGLLDPDVRAL